MSKDFDFHHLPVLYQETLDLLAIKPEGTYVDCTLGGGGHSSGILQELNAAGRLIAFDKDKKARDAAAMRLEEIASEAKWELLAADFSDLAAELNKINIYKVDGILADLGVSSVQLDQAKRGFSYHKDGPLDMRMDQDKGQTAADIVNRCTEEYLTEIFRKYGEERYAARVAKAIVKRRLLKPFSRTLDLAEIIKRALPTAALKEKQHPARRVFQALRIAVNNELTALENLLAQAPDLLNDSGRICIISFHSLEDRMVKQTFRQWEHPCQCPRNFPVCVCGLQPLGRQIQPKGVVASERELSENIRSKSARLRCFAKLVQEG